jgi:hypothetical protein
MGIGIPYESTWSYLISQNLELANFNLAVDGGAADTCFRMAVNWIHQLRPKIVLYQSPEVSRLEWFEITRNRPHVMLAMSNNHSSFYKEWISNENNLKYNHLKNLYAIQHLSESIGAKFIHIQLDRIAPIDYAKDTVNHQLNRIVRMDCARDIGHYGPVTHRITADMVISAI